jgi:branched-subunit amino acid transport protein
MIPALTLAAVAVGSWGLRSAFITLVDVDDLPAGIRGALDLIGPAVMAALVVTSIAHGEGHAGLVVPAAELAGLAAAALIALRYGSLLWSVVGAIGTYVALGLLLA